VNTHPLPDRSDYARLAHAPLVLLVLVALMRTSAGSSLSVVALDLLALAMGLLVAWLGGVFVLPHEVPVERRRTRRFSLQEHLRHKTV